MVGINVCVYILVYIETHVGTGTGRWLGALFLGGGNREGGFIRQMAAIVGSKNRKELIKTIEAPTLIIHGDIDPLIKVTNAYIP